MKSSSVRAKKHLGQHFLADKNIADKIALGLGDYSGNVLEIGPGTGVLTHFLLENSSIQLSVVEIDNESVDYLQAHFENLKINSADFLKEDLTALTPLPCAIIGNFPYNISSQILFKTLDYKEDVPLLVGMFQKEMAERVCAPHGNKTYGILSVLIQAFYDVEYLFTVPEQVFIPPPKVKSGVIRLTRKSANQDIDTKKLFRVVKGAFNQRRKRLSNSLKAAGITTIPAQFADKRPEQLSVDDFIALTKLC